jgi:hypothetical protein
VWAVQLWASELEDGLATAMTCFSSARLEKDHDPGAGRRGLASVLGDRCPASGYALAGSGYPGAEREGR